jgi:hypothetical protein
MKLDSVRPEGPTVITNRVGQRGPSAAVCNSSSMRSRSGCAGKSNSCGDTVSVAEATPASALE